jgi:hypothetical protein
MTGITAGIFTRSPRSHRDPGYRRGGGAYPRRRGPARSCSIAQARTTLASRTALEMIDI